MASAPAPDADAAVEEGNGWKRVSPGTWVYDLGFDAKAPTIDLVAPPPGRGLQRFELPAGAKEATLESISALMTGGGDSGWAVFAAAGPGVELGAELSRGGIGFHSSGAPEPGPGKGVWSRSAFSGLQVNSPFVAVFTTESGAPSVAAVEGSAPGNVWYQPAPSDAPQRTKYVAYVRVTLTNVR
jgi:hypothetical protein